MYKILVVGGGIFGIVTAVDFAKKGYDVTLHEELDEVMKCASSINQYRLHKGYHYPRSKITAYECLRSVKQFNTRFAHSIINGNTEHYYSIAKENSFINGGQYIKFLDEVGLDYKIVEPFKNADVTVKVEEELFDHKILRQQLIDDMNYYNVNVKLNHTTTKDDFENFDYVIISTYSRINDLVDKKRKYQFEVCEKPVVKLPLKYKNKSVVVMDGPFMCFDPYGQDGLHVLGNVVHAIHGTNVGYKPMINNKLKDYLNNGVIENPKITKIEKFIETANEYFDGFEDLEHIGSMYTIRTVLSDREHDDARPTMVTQESEKTFSIFSGKIVTCVGVVNEITKIIER